MKIKNLFSVTVADGEIVDSYDADYEFSNDMYQEYMSRSLAADDEFWNDVALSRDGEYTVLHDEDSNQFLLELDVLMNL